ncbi:MAG TPA: glycoside hydrolase family 3 C-terminal domain-containing protein [Candidatus Eisenbergiella merdigallinarum]|uniref:Glycoside hydrolase family 3 C-terminal domain-containing protein n=1 Tax=Candidatus Eisenbergiella merdigallinarum TaxID=2838552 RepID=A0A9D2SDA5_9FIRM|nr:glycoside hydrolase family 3 C-terminal domain-containing protein [Candidatus Eisenbergiella merdigallinarum]
MKHADLIAKMTLEEKAAILSGASEWESRAIKRLDLPSIFFSDGPHGVRKQEGAGDHLGLNASVPATCFPTAATVANSWDESLGEELGKALGEEAAALGVDVLLGPGLNIKRSPLCGRNFEYFSEDPYLAGKMAASYVKGIQSRGVYACPKHFAVNSQEERRMAMNSVLDERTLREIYLTGFEIAVKEAKAKTIMSSYNEINGVYANENEHLLLEILRDEWGFDGIVVTDWGASNDHVKAVACRSNVEMPAPGLDPAREIIAAIEDGTLKMQELDACVDDLLDAVLYLAQSRKNHKKEFDREAHHELARKAARESIVMLKNGPEGLLPLKENAKVALIGDFAITPRYQGAGSSMVNPTKVETMSEEIRNYPLNCVGCVQGYRRTGEADEALKKAALDLAGMADVVIYCFGLDELSESEGLDRTHMRIPQNQIELLEALVKVNPNIVGVLSAGSSIEMPWHYCCKSILHGYLGGQAGAGAMLDVLTGRANPSGRLSETYPIRYEDTPAFRNFPATERNSEYRESIFVGYRYFDTSKVRVQYPFGYGLSYTSFEYSDLNVSEDGASFTVKNAGDMDGAEVAQLYVAAPKGKIFRPDKELKGFAKVFLKAGESKTVRIPFDDKTFRYWNTKTGGWEVEAGEYAICIGANVSDIRLKGSVTKAGTAEDMPYDALSMPKYFSGMVQEVSDQEFERLLGHPIPSGKWSGELTKNDAICQMYYARSGLARLIYKVLTNLKKKSEAKGKPDLNILFIYNMPFRGIAKMTGGAVSLEMVDGMVQVVNGHFFRGMGKIIGGFFRNSRANREFEKKLNG